MLASAERLSRSTEDIGMALALVTGASGGIGLALAEELASRRTNLVLTARSGEALDRVCLDLSGLHGVQATSISLDLSRPDASKALVPPCGERGLEPDILVNNAGFATYGKFHEQSLDVQLEMIRLNVSAVVELTGLLLPKMVERGQGYILNVASTAAFQPGPLMSAYYASKAFVLHFSEGLSNELEGTGVKVTALCPGPTESGFPGSGPDEGFEVGAQRLDGRSRGGACRFGRDVPRQTGSDSGMAEPADGALRALVSTAGGGGDCPGHAGKGHSLNARLLADP